MQKAKFFKSILLVAGTSIGGGMLALPVLTSAAGFWPSMLIYILCWAFMTCTGLLLVEACLWMKPNANLVTINESTLGLPGKISSWILYLFLYYSLTIAYMAGCGGLLVTASQQTLLTTHGVLLFVLLFAPWVMLGAHYVGKINEYLMYGLIAAYIGFLVLGFSHVDVTLLKRFDLSEIFSAIPIAFTAFAYQGVVPSLVTYLDRDGSKARWSIILGGLIVLTVYIIWQILILGIIPLPQLQEALKQGQTAVYPLQTALDNPKIYLLGQFLAFFALTTSFLGVTLGLKDFLADGLKLHDGESKHPFTTKTLLAFLVFGPPLAITLTFPNLFLIALDFAGGFGCALLLGLLPVLAVWSGRYRQGRRSTWSLAGGKPLLVALILFVLFELLCQTEALRKLFG